MFIVLFRSFLARLEFTQTYAFALSYDFKGMSHNLELLIKLSEIVWFVKVYKKKCKRYSDSRLDGG